MPKYSDNEINEELQQNSWEETIRLGQRGIQMSCDADRADVILAMDDQTFIQEVENQESVLRNPCQTYELPHTLAFNYFYYLNDLEGAIKYYKLAAFHDEAPTITASMPTILRGRQGQHLISAQLWLDKAVTIQSQDGFDSSNTMVAEYNRAIQKSIHELQLHLLGTADDIDDTECARDYSCLVNQ
jgi:hypothetical protein